MLSLRRQPKLPFDYKRPVASDKHVLTLMLEAELHSDLMNTSRFSKVLWEESESKHEDCCSQTHMCLAK